MALSSAAWCSPMRARIRSSTSSSEGRTKSKKVAVRVVMLPAKQVGRIARGLRCDYGRIQGEGGGEPAGDQRDVRRLIAVAAMRNGREIGGVGLDHQTPGGNAAQSPPQIIGLGVSHRTGDPQPAAP